jgi:nucleoside-diphosphate-sugar epimerase
MTNDRPEETMSEPEKFTVLVTGGAGYVGSVLVPKLLAEGHAVRVLDTYWFGDDVLSAVAGHPRLTEIKGDMRDRATLELAVKG